MNHALLVAALVERQLARPGQLGLQQRLAEPRDVAVAEDPEAALDEPGAGPVPLAELGGQEPDHGLPDGQPAGAHVAPPGR
jgi:hypothetical protein